MVKIFRDLNWFIKKNWFKYLLIILLTILFTYSVTLPAQFLGDIIDEIDRKTIDRDYVIYILLPWQLLSSTYLSELKDMHGSLTHKLFDNYIIIF